MQNSHFITALPHFSRSPTCVHNNDGTLFEFPPLHPGDKIVCPEPCYDQAPKRALGWAAARTH